MNCAGKRVFLPADLTAGKVAISVTWNPPGRHYRKSLLKERSGIAIGLPEFY
jgi:hypothetical protein